MLKIIDLMAYLRSSVGSSYLPIIGIIVSMISRVMHATIGIGVYQFRYNNIHKFLCILVDCFLVMISIRNEFSNIWFLTAKKFISRSNNKQVSMHSFPQNGANAPKRKPIYHCICTKCFLVLPEVTRAAPNQDKF